MPPGQKQPSIQFESEHKPSGSSPMFSQVSSHKLWHGMYSDPPSHIIATSYQQKTIKTYFYSWIYKMFNYSPGKNLMILWSLNNSPINITYKIGYK